MSFYFRNMNAVLDCEIHYSINLKANHEKLNGKQQDQGAHSAPCLFLPDPNAVR